MVRCSRLVIFYFREKFCFARVGKSCHFQDVYFLKRSEDLVEKIISPIIFQLTQIVHSNDKMLFLEPNNYLSKFLWRAAHV